MGDSSPAHSGCLDENKLAEFAEGQADPTATEEIIEHVAARSECGAPLACAAPAVDTSAEDERSTPLHLDIGDVVCDRFVIERLAGSGGMGTVYRALDRVGGEPVALKVMSHPRRHDDRFAQEARVLAGLRHPAIVRYVAHGATAQGQMYLAMQWLEGEDLARRLSRSALEVTESLAVARRLAGGLAVAHARGMVHRDVKPSNVQLVAGDPFRATLLDFGIVHMGLSGVATTARPRTETGTVMGTVGYMSPEQAIADKHIDASADVFALGCVLFECLTGVPTFSGAHVAAVLAKVFREEAPRIRELRADLPPALDDLVARMLAKERAERPEDGAAVLRELEALGRIEGGAPDVAVPRPVGLSGGEQRLVSVMLAAVPDQPDAIRQIIRLHGGDPVRLANGALLVTVSGGGSPGVQVFATAACAIGMREAFPSARVAVATGRARTAAGGLTGPVIEGAAALLAQSTSPGVRVDEVTARLLGERFNVRPDGTLLARRSDAEPPRTLLGKPTPCVGREKELALLELTLRECVDESVPRAVLVTGPAGQGKSRLHHEFVAKVREGGDASILTARADPVGAGSAFLMVRQLVHQAVGIRDSDPATQQHARLRTYVQDVCQGVDFARIADFLGELIAVPSTGPPSPQLRAARDDPQIMAAWLGRSFGEWLAAVCARRPLLIVLEDLHWGDLPSVTYLGEGLRALATKPLMILALARPEVHEIFPAMWSGAEKNEIVLGRLAPRAAERLVRAALGGGFAGEVIARIVERADGNAFYLEELIRRVAEGAGDTLPETVLALVQSRLERLEPEGRRILRAASVFGEVFWRGGVAALLGAVDPEEPGAWLDSLARSEMISAMREGRHPGDHEYVFRHGLLREAAYTMLTEEDRTTGHRLAAQWLERVGEKDALMLADHFELGGEQQIAGSWLSKAAMSALDAGSTHDTLLLCNRALACGVDDAHRGNLERWRAAAFVERGDLIAAIASGGEALSLLPPGSPEWFSCAANLFGAATILSDHNVTIPTLQAILSAPAPSEPSMDYAWAISATSLGLTAIGQLDLARSLLDRAEAIGASDASNSLLVARAGAGARSYLDLVTGNLAGAFRRLLHARGVADRMLVATDQASARMLLVAAYAEVGDCAMAEAVARELRSLCEPVGLRFFLDRGATSLARAKLNAGRVEDAIEHLRPLLSQPDQQVALAARSRLAHAFLASGDLDSATIEADAVLAQGVPFPTTQCTAFAALALVAMNRGRPLDALSFTERGLAAESRGGWLYDGSVLRFSRAEALFALKREDEARIAIAEARDRVLHIAAPLDDPALRHSYLNRIVANARTLSLAKEWAGPDDSG